MRNMASIGRLVSCSRLSSVYCRCFCNTPTFLAKPNRAKKTKVLQKSNVLLSRKIEEKYGGKKKKQWYDTPMGLGGAVGFDRPKKGPTAGMRRRAHQLSVVLSQYVISLINSGELDSRLPNLGVEITGVKLVADLGALHVYWLATGSKDDDVIQKILAEASHQLRTYLTGLHVMNKPPPVVFIKDLSQARLQEVETLLERADMGPDYEASDLGADLKSDIVLPQIGVAPTRTSLQQQIDSARQNLSFLDLESSDNVRTVPRLSNETTDVQSGIDLRSDIYELDHAGLTQKVLQVKRRKVTRGLRISEADASQGLILMPELPKETIQKFLTMRKITEKRPSANNLLDSELYKDDSHVSDGNEDFENEELDYEDDDPYKV